MNNQEFFKIVDYILDKGVELVQKHLEEEELPLDYVHIFSKSETEYNEFLEIIKTLGKLVDQTPTSLNYQLDEPYKTKHGLLKVIGIRRYDPEKPQRGAPDFRVANYEKFKEKYKHLMKLIVRPEFEMLELSDAEFDIFVYFLNSPLTLDLGI